MQTAYQLSQASATDLTIGDVLTHRLVRPQFQPIVDLSTRAVVGLEALARGPAGTGLEYPDALFGAARSAGLLGPLDLLCSERALECAVAASAPPPLLFVNAEPAVLDQPLSPRLIELLAAGLPFREILEFTERALPSAPRSLLRVAGLAQQWGHGIALDDVGVDPMSLSFLPLLDPQVIKMDLSLIRNPEADSTRLVAALVQAQAQRTGAVVIAEGVETEADLEVARALGAHWGQGWLFGRPGPIDAGHRYDRHASSRLPAPDPGFHQPTASPFEIGARHHEPRPATAIDIAAAVARLRAVAGLEASIVVTVDPRSGPASQGEALREVAGLAHTAIVLDPSSAGEFAATAFGPGHGFALCLRTIGSTQQIITDDCPVEVATITRAMLSHEQI